MAREFAVMHTIDRRPSFTIVSGDPVPMSKRRKGTKLGVEAPQGPNVNLSKHSAHAAEFSEKHIPAWSFDMRVCSGDSWLASGASLLRASRAVMRQCELDGSTRRSIGVNWKPGDSSPPPPPAALHLEVIFLAAFALENALKAVIAEGMPFPPPNPPSGKLPGELNGHDLSDLAVRAAINPIDSHEEDAVKRGQNFTEWLGRYPTTIAHDEQHSVADIPDLRVLSDAYERLFFRCVEEVARRMCHRYGTHATKDPEKFAAERRAQYERFVASVDPLPQGTVPVRIGFTIAQTTVTTPRRSTP